MAAGSDARRSCRRSLVQKFYTAGGKRLTAPSSNVEISEAEAVLVPNILVRGFVADYRKAKTEEWAAMAEAAAAAAAAGVGEGQGLEGQT